MRKLLKSVVKVNLWFCAVLIITDMYGKVCEMHKILTEEVTE